MNSAPYSVLEYFTHCISPVSLMTQTAQMDFNPQFIYHEGRTLTLRLVPYTFYLVNVYFSTRSTRD